MMNRPTRRKQPAFQKDERGKDTWKKVKVGSVSNDGGAGGASLNLKQIQILGGNTIEGIGLPGISWSSEDISSAPSLSGANINDLPFDSCPDGIGIGRIVNSNTLTYVKNTGFATQRHPLLAGMRIVAFQTESIAVDAAGEVTISAYIPASVGV